MVDTSKFDLKKVEDDEIRVKMTDDERKRAVSHIRMYIKVFIKNNFPDLLPDLQHLDISINNRLKKVYGRFGNHKYLTERRNMVMEFSGKDLMVCKSLGRVYWQGFYDQVVLHETLHMVAYLQKKPFSDGSNYFESLLAKYNGASSGQTAESKQQAHMLNLPALVYGYTCGCEGNVTVLNQKYKDGYYRCTQCKQPLKYDGVYVVTHKSFVA